MIGVDSNVLLRLLVDDDKAQVEAVAVLFRGRGAGSIRIPQVVLVETVWSLRRSFRMGKERIVEILANLLGREELVFEGRSTVMTAFEWYRRGNADFSDYLIAASNAESGAVPTYTFDHAAAAHPAFAELPIRTI
ncbi:MAG: type II toxin-antitoxin system VapC family toxin [Bauldia sp.]|nr:type II toxin-antitoxin system VapC family toxin [Bauldia sp.]